jgi:hypothetical protein
MERLLQWKQQCSERVFVAFGIQLAMCVRHFVVCGLPVSTLSHKWQIFGQNIIERKMCDSIFSTTSVWKVSPSKKK